MKRKINKKIYIAGILIIFVSIGFAVVSSTLSILGITKVAKSKWDVHFENILPFEDNNVVATSEPTINPDTKTEVTCALTLSLPGDQYGFYVDVVNAGTIDAMIENIDKKLNNEVLSQLPSYLEYVITYANNSEIKEKEQLVAGQKKRIKVNVAYKKDINASDLPKQDAPLKLSFAIEYVQSDNTAIADPTLCKNNINVTVDSDTICKRAENLHEEKCLNEEESKYCLASGYSNGDSIIYGNCGTSGKLTPGDAFVCDVNGDGDYSNEEELFYYLSPKDMEESSDYVSLIYSKNTNIQHFGWAVFSNTDGPDSSYDQLPHSDVWPNVQLVSNKRQIYNELGTTSTIYDNDESNLPNFDYNYLDKIASSRYVTLKELQYACGIEPTTIKVPIPLNNCDYLFENTNFAKKVDDDESLDFIFTETASSEFHRFIYVANVKDSVINTESVFPAGVIKPVIEVAKSKIKY